jgi:hypothetical protein
VTNTEWGPPDGHREDRRELLKARIARFVATVALFVVAFSSAAESGGLWTIMWSAFAAAAVGQSIGHWTVKSALRAHRRAIGKFWIPLVAVGILLPLTMAYGMTFLSAVAPPVASFLTARSPWLALATVGSWSTFAILTSLSVRFGPGRQTALKDELIPVLMIVFGGSEVAWRENSGVRRNRDGAIRIWPVPAGVGALLAFANDRLAIELPGYQIDQSSTPQAILLVPVGSDEVHRRDTLEGSERRVTAIIPMKPTPARPAGHELWKLALGSLSAQNAGLLDARAREQGKALCEWDPINRSAFVAELPPVHMALRDRLAALLEVETWQIEIVVVPDPHDSFPRIVEVLRYPADLRAEVRIERWLTALRALAGIPAYWKVSDDIAAGRMIFERTTDPLAEIIPYAINPRTTIAPSTPWGIGIDENGEAVSIDLAGSAHLLLAGATRSGKSVLTYSLLTHVIRMGPKARLLVCDPNDTTIAPFERLVSWSTNEVHPAPVTAMLGWVREEMDRRKPLLRAQRRDKIDVFTEDQPLIVIVIDEASNYLRSPDVQAAKALQTELLAVVSQGAKFGIRVVLIAQRPDSTILPTAIRSQLSARISFRLEDRETSAMVFPDISDPTELLSCPTGVGLIKEIIGRPRRFRAAYMADHWGIADQIATPLPRVSVLVTRQAQHPIGQHEPKMSSPSLPTSEAG